MPHPSTKPRTLMTSTSTASIVDLCAEVSHGSIVAIEGDDKVVATQLRLLPISSKILCLPPLADEVNKLSTSETPFDSRTHIRNVHATFNARTETARSFLQFSTSDQPRLVFMNGGCVSARTTCIANICEHVTNGAIGEAERIFDQLVQDGVAGLMRQEVAQPGQTAHGVHDANEQLASIADQERQHSSTAEHSSNIAMKRADSLYRRTSDLEQGHENNIVVEDPVKTDRQIVEGNTLFTHAFLAQPQRTQLQQDKDVVLGLEKNIIINHVDHEPELVIPPQNPARLRRQGISRALFTTPFGDAIRETVLSIPIRPDTPDEHSMNESVSRSESPSREHDTYLAIDDHATDRYSIPPTPLGNVILGEACIVDIQSAKDRKGSKRVHSVDRSYERATSPFTTSAARPTALRKASSYQDLRSKASKQGGNRGRSASGSVSSFESLPRTSFMKASQTTIKRSPTLKNTSMITAPPRVFTDRGTDAHEVLQDAVEQDHKDESGVEPFQPVFPVVEDLIIHFSGTNDEIFEKVIRSYKDGSYPVMPNTEEQRLEVQSREESQTVIRPDTAEEDDQMAEQGRPFSPTSHTTSDTDLSQYQDFDPDDPYRSSHYGNYVNATPLWPQRRTSKKYIHPAAVAEPPTPATTPPPIDSEVAQKFHEFTPINSTSAVGIQNSLRSVLNGHFGPPETTNYTQYIAKTEDDRFWKPVFRYDDEQGSEGRTVDQILALGCEDGVSKDFLNEISGQIEKLGTKKSGISRTGKLDIRYLIATAMQTHTTLPLTAQSGMNPFSDPLSLATTLVAPLETYLSTNPATRFLILSYPASHIATIISLRKLLGGDLFKVSGIIDALSSDPPNFSSGRVSPAPLMLPTLAHANTGTSSTSLRHKPVPSLSSFARTRAELARQVTSRQSLTNINAAPAQRLSRGSSYGPNADPSLTWTRANYLLPSTATDAEISTFLSNIWKNLIEKSQWYTPEPVSPISSPANIPPILASAPRISLPSPPNPTSISSRDFNDDLKSTRSQPTTSAIAAMFPKPASRSVTSASLESAASPPLTPSKTSQKLDQILGSSPGSRTNTLKSSTQNGLNGNPTSLSPSTSNHNISPSTVVRSSKNSMEKRRENQRAWDDFNMPDDISDDEFERKLMPRVPIRVAGKKGNSRKALKWLGLAQ